MGKCRIKISLLLVILIFQWVRNVLSNTREGLFLKIATYNNPLANISGVPITSMGLIEAEVLELLSEKLNFAYEMLVPSDMLQMGILRNNGSWSGIFNLIDKEEADMTISYGPRNWQRYQSFDITTHVITENAVIMIPYPTSTLHPSSIVTVLPRQVWVLFAVTTLSAVSCIWLLGLVGTRNSDSLYSLHYYVLGVILSQGGWLKQNSTPLRLTLTALLLGLLVLTYAYTSSLISNLMAPRYTFLAKSIDDVTSNSEITPIVWQGSSTHGEIMDSVLPSLREIRRRLELNPDSVRQDIHDAIELTQNTTQLSVIIDGDIFLHQLLTNDYDKIYKKCRALILDNKALRIWRNNLFLPKNSNKLKPVLDRQLLLLREYGISQHLEQKHRAVCMRRCAINEKVDHRPRAALTLHQLKGAFYALSLGCSLSVILFMLENFLRVLNLRNKAKGSQPDQQKAP